MYANGADSHFNKLEIDDPEGGQFTSLGGQEDEKFNRTPRGRTLGGDRPRDRNPVPIREIRSIALPMDVDTHGETSASGARIRLPIPPVRTIVSVKIEGRDGDVFEGKNSEDGSGTFLTNFSSLLGSNLLFSLSF